jgi:ATP-binding cassette subfamily B multidrug efflux pump
MVIKTLSREIKQYKKASLMSVLFAAAEVVMEILLPLMMARIIDDGISKGSMENVLKYGAIMAVLALCSLTFGFFCGKSAAKASSGFASNLRTAMYENIQRFSFANIDKYSTAGLVTRLTTDITNVQNAYQMIIRMCVRAPFSMIFALAMTVVISPRLSVIFFAAILFLGVVLIFIIRHATRAFSAVFTKYDNMNASVQENVTGIRVVKSFVREEHEDSKFRKSANDIYRLFVHAESFVCLNFPVMMLTVYACILALSWMGAHMIVSGTLTTGELTSLFSYVMNILISLMMLSMAFVMITMSEASARRIAEVLNETPSIRNPEHPVMEIADGSVDFEHVNFTYGVREKPVDWDDPEVMKKLKAERKLKRKNGTAPAEKMAERQVSDYVLSDVTFHVNKGETIGIIGGTGSSKSSLVNLIPRMYDAVSGSVKVGGRDVREYDVESLRNSVSVVLQKNELFSGTILENLKWGDENATEEECRRACRLSCADEFIESFPEKYGTRIEQGGNNVSGGQKQRICIARALLKKPKILILDDSTSAVDTATDAKIRKAFREEIPDTTKFIISQRISSVKDADRIMVLDNGRISGFDTHENLLRNNEIYRSVAEGQAEGLGDFDQKKEA